MHNNLHCLIEKNHDWVVSLRQYFHTYPELSTKEYNTQKRIMEELTKLGLNPKKIADTGVLADVVGNKSGKTVAIRADIDALALSDECGKPYQSVNHGVCHGCGHDGHTAMLLGIAKVLTELKGDIPGTIRLLFQPSEEQLPGGALALVREGALDGVDAIIGAHLWQNIPVGKIGLTFGRMMASADSFSITVKGHGGHGSAPEETIDALLTAAQLTVALNTIISRNISALDSAVLSVGCIKSGDAFNIIPSVATIKGTVRSFSQDVRMKIFDRIEQVTQGTCSAAGATYDLDKQFGIPPVINNADIATVLFNTGQQILGKDNVLEIPPVLGGEDFAYYLEKIPGAFMFLGSGNTAKGISYPHHHSKFDIDEDALAHGVEVLTTTALALLK